MNRLYLVEGLPGTGKTTATRWLADRLAAAGRPTTTLLEGDDRSPCDFYQTAGVPLAEYGALCRRTLAPGQAPPPALRTKSYAYLRIDQAPTPLAQALARWDMGEERNRKITPADYAACALERLEHWADIHAGDGDGAIMVIDSGYLQNPINELLFRGADEDAVRAYITAIALLLRPLDPVCVYLQRGSAREAIDFAKAAKGPQWAARVDSLLAELGVPDLFQRRFELELELLPLLPHLVCPVRGSDWSEAYRRMEGVLPGGGP